MKRLITVTGLIACAIPALLAANAKMAQDLEGVDPNSTVDVIVTFRTPPGNAQQQKVLAAGGKLKRSLELIRAGLYSLPAKALKNVAADPNVAHISPNRPVTSFLDYGEPAVNAAIAIEYGWDGQKIGVAVIDSGVADTADLSEKKEKKSRIVYSESFVQGDAVTDDLFGHGTHVAGIIAGNGRGSANGSRHPSYLGVAPGADIVSLRVLDANGNGTDSSVIAAIQQAVALRKRFNIRVINLSLGRGVYESFRTDPLCLAVESAWRAGIVVVVAAGNSGRDNSFGNGGYGTITSPGHDPYVITVGAMKTMGTVPRGDDLIASYSSKGPSLIDHVVKPDIVAPGNRVTSLLAPRGQLARWYPASVVPAATSGSDAPAQSYFRMSGTSMAAPMVSGAAALLIQKEPKLSPDTVKARLLKSATREFPAFSIAVDPLTGETFQSHYDIFTVGAGYLDVWAALNSTDTVPAGMSAASPVASYDPSTGTISIASTDAASWNLLDKDGLDAVWATRRSAVWGTGTTAVWAAKRTAVWGTGTPGSTSTSKSDAGAARLGE